MEVTYGQIIVREDMLRVLREYLAETFDGRLIVACLGFRNRAPIEVIFSEPIFGVVAGGIGCPCG